MSLLTAPQETKDFYRNLTLEASKTMFTNEQQTWNQEATIWETIGEQNYDLADALTDVYTYESALHAIQNNLMPINNALFRQVVIGIAYNALLKNEDWEYLLEHSNFQISDIQKLIDMATIAIVQNENFSIQSFQHLQPMMQAKKVSETYACTCKAHNCGN